MNDPLGTQGIVPRPPSMHALFAPLPEPRIGLLVPFKMSAPGSDAAM
jgi:hypothetical protein